MLSDQPTDEIKLIAYRESKTGPSASLVDLAARVEKLRNSIKLRGIYLVAPFLSISLLAYETVLIKFQKSLAQ